MKRELLSGTKKLELLALKPNDITLEKLKSLLACTSERSTPYMPATAEFELDIAKDVKPDFTTKDFEVTGYPLNMSPATDETKKVMKTTVGRYIANLFLFGGSINIRKNVPYVNVPFTKGTIGNINNLLSRLLLEQKITDEDLADYINREQWLGYSPTSFLSPSFEYESTQPLPKVIKFRDELLDANMDKLSGDQNGILVYQGLEKQILSVAKDELEKLNTGGMDIYESGASGSFSNNYKSSSVMRGFTPKSDEPTSFNFSKSNLADGIQPHETSQFADLAILASFSRAVGKRLVAY